MSDHQADYPIASMCRLLGVSSSGYYAWMKRRLSRRAETDAALIGEIRAAHAASLGTYGAPRIHAELTTKGMQVGRKRVARLMSGAGLAGVSRRKYVVTTVKSDSRQAPDLVERNFTAEAPDLLWVADITYVPTWAGFLYLAVVLDAFSRRIVGWSMATTLATQLVLDALNMALVTRRPSGVIHHSDQGSQAELKWSSQHLGGGVAMTRRKRRSDRSGRTPLFSPGRPVVAGRDEQRRSGVSLDHSAVACRAICSPPKAGEACAQLDIACLRGGTIGRRRRHSERGSCTRPGCALERPPAWTAEASAVGKRLEPGADCSPPAGRLPGR